MLNPIKFDGEEIIEPISWSEDSDVIETVNETEAGTDQVAVTRYDKLSVACAFQCSHRWAKKFKEYSRRDEISVNFYNILTESYTARQMRIRDFKISLVDNSWRTPNTNGLWNVSFSLIEF